MNIDQPNDEQHEENDNLIEVKILQDPIFQKKIKLESSLPSSKNIN